MASTRTSSPYFSPTWRPRKLRWPSRRHRPWNVAVLAHDFVDFVFDAGELVVRHRLRMREIKAQPIGRQRALLRHMRSSTCFSAACRDASRNGWPAWPAFFRSTGLDGIAERELAAGHLDDMDVHVAELFSVSMTSPSAALAESRRRRRPARRLAVKRRLIGQNAPVSWRGRSARVPSLTMAVIAPSAVSMS